MQNQDLTPREQLEAEERALSKRRARLHDRIDFLRGSGRDEPDAEERLARMLEEERALSAKRRELQAKLDALSPRTSS